MHTAGVVRWFDRSTGIGVLTLDDDGQECVVARLDLDANAAAALAAGAGQSSVAGASPPAGRDRAHSLDLAAAVRAGTWGDGGRDY